MSYEVIYFCSPKLSDELHRVNEEMISTLQDMALATPLSMGLTGLDVEFDFNSGFRMKIPAGNWHVKIWDEDTQTEFFDDDVSNALLFSLEKFFVRWAFEIFRDGESVARYVYNPSGQNVHFQFLITGIGDQISIFPYIEEFCRKWNCTATCTTEPYLRDFFKNYFPKIEFVDAMPANTYARYGMGPVLNPFFSPTEFRKISLQKTGGEILRLNDVPKKIYRPTKPRQISEPYVCIAAQASCTPKAWLNPNGWDEVIAYLKNLGYRVLCIDKNSEQTDQGLTVKMPVDAENFTGDIPLIERVNLLAYADFFIGLSSGLSWLAWSVDIPVILISGITAAWCEFETPYRIWNPLVCNGCYNDTKMDWSTFVTCPRHKGTSRAFECSKKISARQVINAVDEIRSRKNFHDSFGNRSRHGDLRLRIC